MQYEVIDKRKTFLSAALYQKMEQWFVQKHFPLKTFQLKEQEMQVININAKKSITFMG